MFLKESLSITLYDFSATKKSHLKKEELKGVVIRLKNQNKKGPRFFGSLICL